MALVRAAKHRTVELRSIALCTGLVLVDFAWVEPGSPAITYLVAIDMARPRPYRAGVIAHVARSAMRIILAPGWRNDVRRIWLGPGRVLIQPPADRDKQPQWDAQWTRSMPGHDDARANVREKRQPETPT